MNWNLTPLEQDLLKEVANIGLSKAADALAILAKEKVLLHVPEIKLVSPKDLIRVVMEENKNDALLINSDIIGELNGSTILIFSEKDTASFILSSISDLDVNGSYEKMKNSFLLELANIVTGSVLTQLSNIFGVKVIGSVPGGPKRDTRKAVKEILDQFSSFQPLILTVKTRFLNSGRNLQLPLIIILDTDTMLKLVMFIRARNVLENNILGRS